MKVLLIDDNESIVKMLEKFLTIKGHTCISCMDGRNALSIIAREKFDVIILDLAMPEFTGQDIVDILEKSGDIKKQNILVLTASVLTAEQKESLLKQGVKACMKKPVTPEVLCEMMDSHSV